MLKINGATVPKVVKDVIKKIDKFNYSVVKVGYKNGIVMVSNLDNVLCPEENYETNPYLPQQTNIDIHTQHTDTGYVIIITSLMIKLLYEQGVIEKFGIVSNNKLGSKLLEDSMKLIQEDPNFIIRGCYYKGLVDGSKFLIITDYFIQNNYGAEALLKKIFRKRGLSSVTYSFLNEHKPIATILEHNGSVRVLGKEFSELLLNSIQLQTLGSPRNLLKLILGIIDNKQTFHSGVWNEAVKRLTALINGTGDIKFNKNEPSIIHANESTVKQHKLANVGMIAPVVYFHKILFSSLVKYSEPNDLTGFVEALYKNEEFVANELKYIFAVPTKLDLNKYVVWPLHKSKEGYNPILLSGSSDGGKWVGLFYPYSVFEKDGSKMWFVNNAVVGWVTILPKTINPKGIVIDWFGNKIELPYVRFKKWLIYNDSIVKAMKFPHYFPIKTGLGIIKFAIIPPVTHSGSSSQH